MMHFVFPFYKVKDKRINQEYKPSLLLLAIIETTISLAIGEALDLVMLAVIG